MGCCWALDFRSFLYIEIEARRIETKANPNKYYNAESLHKSSWLNMHIFTCFDSTFEVLYSFKTLRTLLR